MTRVGVVGVDHLHVFEMIDRLVKAGAETVAHAPGPGGSPDLLGMYAGWRTGSEERAAADIIGDQSIDLVVTAAVPNRRAEIAIAAIEAGKHVVSDKPGVTTMAQLDAVRAACVGRGGRPWTVLFTERFENRAIAEAVRLARAGSVGDVVHVIGAGPHTMWADRRPDWFWHPEATGGILVDIGSHQADQFVAVTGADADELEVVGAAVGNVASPDHPGMQDIGSMSLLARTGAGVRGDHRLDYLTAAGLGTWGDVRLTIVGTAGTIEAPANIDVAGAEGGEHLIVVDADGTRRVDVSGVAVDWAELLLADLGDGGERLMTQQHVFTVTDLTLRAQAMATDWKRGQPVWVSSAP